MRASLVALDLDDTLLQPDLRIHPANLAAVRRALDRGVLVMLASGRTVESMMPYAVELGMKGRGLPMICANGSEVRDVDSGELRRRITLSPAQCLEAIAAVEGFGLPVQAYAEGSIIVTRANAWADRDGELTGLPIRVGSRDELAAAPRSKLLSAGAPEDVARIVPLLRERLAGMANVLVSKPYFIEILPLGADKGEALAWVAASLGVGRDSVMAVGDSGNDLGMVSWAGIGCAPADARADVAAAARFVSDAAHDEGAVAELLERFVLT